jgi:hypothetical protein
VLVPKSEKVNVAGAVAVQFGLVELGVDENVVIKYSVTPAGSAAVRVVTGTVSESELVGIANAVTTGAVVSRAYAPMSHGSVRGRPFASVPNARFGSADRSSPWPSEPVSDAVSM